MKVLGLVFALMLVVSGAAMAVTQTATMDVYDEFSFIGPSLVPVNPNPAAIFSAGGVDIEWTGFITRFDATLQSEFDYQAWDPNSQWNMLLGEGYRVDYRAGTLATIPATVSYQGLPDGIPSDISDSTKMDETMTDMWISLPGNQADGVDAGGFHWISCPFNHPVPFNTLNGFWDGANIKVTDGTTVRTLLDAATVDPIWIQEPWDYYDGASKSTFSAGYLSGVYPSDQLEPGKCYMLKTVKDNLALILPAHQIQ